MVVPHDHKLALRLCCLYGELPIPVRRRVHLTRAVAAEFSRTEHRAVVVSKCSIYSYFKLNSIKKEKKKKIQNVSPQILSDPLYQSGVNHHEQDHHAIALDYAMRTPLAH